MGRTRIETFPKMLYVTEENRGTQDAYFSAMEEPDGEDNQRIALYELVAHGRMTITREAKLKTIRRHKK